MFDQGFSTPILVLGPFSLNTGYAPTLAFAQDFRVAVWTTVGDGAGRKKGSAAYDCVILTKEVYVGGVGAACI